MTTEVFLRLINEIEANVIMIKNASISKVNPVNPPFLDKHREIAISTSLRELKRNLSSLFMDRLKIEYESDLESIRLNYIRNEENENG